ncbi:zinc finger, CCHC-type containing protein [Tanacetum coccineum]
MEDRDSSTQYDLRIQVTSVNCDSGDSESLLNSLSKFGVLKKLPNSYLEFDGFGGATQTSNNNSIRSILEKEKLNGSNILDWYRNLRIVLRNEQKLHHLEEALHEAPPPATHAEQELFETVKAFHACKQEEGQSISTYVLKMKAYLDQMERLGYPMPLVLGSKHDSYLHTKDYDQFVQNYNMYDIGKIITELHAMLKLAEKDIPKKTPDVLAIRQQILKLNKGALDMYVGNGHSAAVEAIGSFELILPSGMILKRIEKLQHDGLLESIDDESFDVCVSCISGKMARKPFTHASERADDLLGIIHKSTAPILNMVPTKKVNKTPYEMWQGKVPNMSYLKVWGCEALVKRDTPNKLESKSIKCIFVGYLKETMGYYFYNPLENKNFVARYAEFFETNLIKEEASGSTVDFDEIQSEDA